MAHRPINKKKAARMRKIISRSPLPVNIDLVEFLRSRGHAQTAGAARKMLTDGKVRSESHVLGRTKVKILEKGEEVEKYVATPVVSAEYRDTLTVLA
jgi:ribosome-associated protein YbcJ (S4-like RNA binding protein)